MSINLSIVTHVELLQHYIMQLSYKNHKFFLQRSIKNNTPMIYFTTLMSFILNRKGNP